jgi:hypothetical protein
MKTLKNIAITLALFAFMGLPALAQGPIIKRLNFDINVPYQLRMTDYVLPEGHYILKQVDQNDINLFWMYKDNMMHSPIAVVRTVRIPTWGSQVPSKTQLTLRMKESGDEAMPVVRGFTIPGEDPFQIISVVPKDTRVLVRVH